MENFAKRVKPLKFCLVSDYPLFGVTVFFFEVPFMRRATAHFRVGGLSTEAIYRDLSRSHQKGSQDL